MPSSSRNPKLSSSTPDRQHCNEKGVTGLGTDGSPRMVPNGILGPCWEHEKDVRVFVEVNLKSLVPFREQAVIPYPYRQIKVGSQAGPRNFLPWSQLRPNPNYTVPIKHFSTGCRNWDQVGIISGLMIGRYYCPKQEENNNSTVAF